MILEIRELRKSFGQTEVLHGISFRVQSGRAMGFLGRNGAGKSTTFRCLMQVFRQDAGEFLLDGKPFDPQEHRIGYLPEERGMYLKTGVADQLIYFARLKGASKREAEEDAARWLRYFELEAWADKKLETLSKGNQQKIQIAQAFLHDPDIIILDEPFSGLDPVNAQVFKNVIREWVSRGKLVIFSSHQMAYVEEMCDEITLIDHGRLLLTGDLEEIRAQKGADRYFIECAPEAVELIRRELDCAGVTSMFSGGRFITEHCEAEVRKIVAGHFGAILSCGRYRPTLQEIFIQEAGEEEHA